MTARDFVKHMEEIINSPNQRLIGNPTTGYIYLDTDEVVDRAIVSSAVKQTLNKCFGTPIKPFIPEIKKVHFNNPATVVLWSDGTKTIVRCGDNDIFDPEKGLAIAIAKKSLGNQGNYYNEFKKWLPEEKTDADDTNDILVEPYEEKDTKCDLCEHKVECNLLECTTVNDTRKHLIPNIDNVCKKPKPIATDCKVKELDGSIMISGTLTEEGVKILSGNPYTVKEYCKLHNFTKNKVYGMIKRGEVRAEKNSKGAWIVYD